MEQEKVFEKALELWGIESQMGMASEEIGEFLVTLNKYRRGIGSAFEVLEEIVDVQIMFDQIVHLLAGRDGPVDGLQNYMFKSYQRKVQRL